MCAADFPIEEKKFGLLLLPEVHRRPGEGDLGKEMKSIAWMEILGRRRKSLDENLGKEMKSIIWMEIRKM